MYVIKMKSIISYLAVIALIIASFGIINISRKNAGELTAVATEETVDGVCVPIIMYHNILKTNKKDGRFIITASQLEEDLAYLEKSGYSTVVMDDLVNYVYNNKPLPEKPIVLTFDDGYYNNYVYAYPLLKKHNFRGVLSIIGYYTDMYSENGEKNEKYSHVTWDDVKEMTSSGVIEIQNHSYNLHSLDKGRNGSKKKKGESKEAYGKMLSEDLGKLQSEIKEHLEITPSTYTYPFGSVSEDSYKIVKDMGFKCSLSCESGINVVSKDKNCLYMMKRCIRTPSSSVEQILNKICEKN